MASVIVSHQRHLGNEDRMLHDRHSAAVTTGSSSGSMGMATSPIPSTSTKMDSDLDPIVKIMERKLSTGQVSAEEYKVMSKVHRRSIEFADEIAGTIASSGYTSHTADVGEAAVVVNGLEIGIDKQAIASNQANSCSAAVENSKIFSYTSDEIDNEANKVHFISSGENENVRNEPEPKYEHEPEAENQVSLRLRQNPSVVGSFPGVVRAKRWQMRGATSTTSYLGGRPTNSDENHGHRRHLSDQGPMIPAAMMPTKCRSADPCAPGGRSSGGDDGDATATRSVSSGIVISPSGPGWTTKPRSDSDSGLLNLSVSAPHITGAKTKGHGRKGKGHHRRHRSYGSLDELSSVVLDLPVPRPTSTICIGLEDIPASPVVTSPISPETLDPDNSRSSLASISSP